MHIALIVTDLTPPRIGGISKVASEISKQFCKKGHQVSVFCLERTVEAFPETPGMNLVPVKSPWSIYKDYPVVSFSIEAFKMLCDMHQNEKFDVSHAMNFNNYGLIFKRGKMNTLGIPHVSTAFETTGMEIKAKSREWLSKPSLHLTAQIVMELFLEPWQRAYIGWADVITSEDTETRHALKAKGVKEEDVMLIPSGIDLDEIQTSYNNLPDHNPLVNNEPLFVCPGRVDPRKGSQFLVKAFAKLQKQYPKAGLVLAGGGRGDYLGKIGSMLDENKLKESVYLTGKVDDLKPWYRAADCIVIPSLSEGIPITLQEALAHRKPVICSKLLGTYEWAKNCASVSWSEPANVDDLLNKMSEFIQEPTSNENIKEGYEFVANFDWSSVADAYLLAYQKAVDNFSKKQSH